MKQSSNIIGSIILILILISCKKESIEDVLVKLYQSSEIINIEDTKSISFWDGSLILSYSRKTKNTTYSFHFDKNMNLGIEYTSGGKNQRFLTSIDMADYEKVLAYSKNFLDVLFGENQFKVTDIGSTNKSGIISLYIKDIKSDREYLLDFFNSEKYNRFYKFENFLKSLFDEYKFTIYENEF